MTCLNSPRLELCETLRNLHWCTTLINATKRQPLKRVIEPCLAPQSTSVNYKCGPPVKAPSTLISSTMYSSHLDTYAVWSDQTSDQTKVRQRGEVPLVLLQSQGQSLGHQRPNLHTSRWMHRPLGQVQEHIDYIYWRFWNSDFMKLHDFALLLPHLVRWQTRPRQFEFELPLLRRSPDTCANNPIRDSRHDWKAGTETGNCETIKRKWYSDTVLHIMTNVQYSSIFINNMCTTFINIPNWSKFLLSDFVCKKGRRAEVHISGRHRQLCFCLWAWPPAKQMKRIEKESRDTKKNSLENVGHSGSKAKHL